jgi:hypothetical protein
VRPIHKRGRNAIVCAVAAFVGLQLGLACAIERWLPELRDPFYAYKAARLRSRVQASKRPFLVVGLGTSRTTFGLKAELLEHELQRTADNGERPPIAFNFGLTGAGPVTQLVVLKRLLAENVRPDLLLIEVLPPMWNAIGTSQEVNRLPPERLWLREVSLVARHCGRSPQELRAAWWRSWPLPGYTHRHAILSDLAPALLPWKLRQDWFRTVDNWGWVDPSYGPVTPDRQQAARALAHEEYGNYLRDYTIRPPARTALRELLELCRRERIPATLIWLPESGEFRSWYSPSALAQIHGFLGDLAGEHNAPLIDARTWMTDESFVDAHHLLPAGAAAFTARLAREVLPSLLERGCQQQWARRSTARQSALKDEYRE